MLRFGRQQPRPTSRGRPNLVRLVVLMGLSVAAIFALRWQALDISSTDRTEPAAENRDFVENALEPPTVPGLAESVFVTGLATTGVTASQDSTEGPAAKGSAEDELPTVNPQRMAGVLDKTTRISPRAYYHLVELATRTPPAVLREHAKSERDITLAHLATEPEKYRGKLIYLEGRLRGLVQFDATKDETLNSTGLAHLYQGDLFTAQSHPYPFVLIMPQVPEGIPQGMDLSENVTFVGYFLQLWRYQSPGHSDRVAPVLVGHMLTWTPTPRNESDSHAGVYFAVAIVLLMVGLGTSVWALNRRPRRAFRVGGGTSPANADPDAVKAELARLEQRESQ